MKKVWIVGASSGIGQSLAHELKNEHIDLYLSSRQISRLDKKQFDGYAQIHLVDVDVTKQESVDQALKQTECLTKPFDEVYYCAGTVLYAPAASTDEAVHRKLFEVNYWGFVNLTQKILPAMESYGNGRLIPISSMTGRIGSPWRSAYAASKHALEGYCQALRAELAGTGVELSVVIPGFIDTGVDLRSLDGSGNLHWAADLARPEGLSPQRCARQIILEQKQGHDEIFIGGKELHGLTIAKLFPSILRKILPNSMPYLPQENTQGFSSQQGITSYRLWGRGSKKIVITNGITSPMNIWDEVIDNLDADSYQILCYDYFHRGHSKLNGPSTGLHHYDSQLIDLLDKLNWKTEEVHFVSYSWGCGWLAKLVNSKKLSFQSMTMIAPTYWHRHQLSSLKFIASGTIGKFLFGLLGPRILYRETIDHSRNRSRAKLLWKSIRPYARRKEFLHFFVESIAAARQWPEEFSKIKDRKNVYGIFPSHDLKSIGRSEGQFLKQTNIQVLGRIKDCGHLVPAEKPKTLAKLLQEAWS